MCLTAYFGTCNHRIGWTVVVGFKERAFVGSCAADFGLVMGSAINQSMLLISFHPLSANNHQNQTYRQRSSQPRTYMAQLLPSFLPFLLVVFFILHRAMGE